MATPSSLESLPLELLTQISDHLHIYDLKRFRMACKTTAEAVFERMVTLMPKSLAVHGKRSEGLMDLAYLGATFKMKDAITRLSIFHMRPEFSFLLANVRLPGLVCLRLANGKVDSENAVIALLENHKPSLRELRIENICIVAPSETIADQKTQGWTWIAVCLSTSSPRFQLRHRMFRELGYCSPDGMIERWMCRTSYRHRQCVPEGE